MVPEVKLDQLRQSWRPTQGLLLLSSTTSMFMVLPQTWLRCPVIRISWFLGLQTPLTGSCTQVQLCVPGSHSGTHRQDSPTQTACKGAAVLYRQPKEMSVSRMLTGLAAKQCQVKCRLGPFNCVNPLSGHRCYKNEKSKEK